MSYTKSNELQTRIALKYDSYANWTAHNPVLLAGEIAIAHIPVPAQNEPNLTGFQNLPNVVMKVGDGSTHYNDLKFVSALAADVYEWAKAATKPSYEAGEIVGLQEFVENISDIDTNTQYSIVPVAGAEYKYELKYSEVTDIDDNKNRVFKSFAAPVYMDMSGADTRLKAIEAVIETLTGTGGEGSGISGMIDTKIQALDSTVEHIAGADGLALKVVQTDGILTEVTGSIAPNTYDAHGAAAAAQAAAEATAAAELKTVKEALEKAIQDEATNRQNAILNLDADGVEGTQEGTIVKFVDKVSQADGVISAELGELHFQSAYNSSTNKAATMKDVVDAVADLNGAMHFEGVSSTDPVNDKVTIDGKEDYIAVAGDIVIYGINEYVFDGNKWIQLGDESIAGALISDLDVDDIEIGADSTLTVLGEADGLIHATPVKIKITKNQVTDLEKDLQDLIDKNAAQDLLIDANADAIEVMQGEDTTKSMRTVAIEEATKSIQNLNKENAAQAGKYISAVTQTNGIVSAEYADLPTIPDLELIEGTATTPEAATVTVIADIDVNGHKITDTRVNVATAAGIAAAIQGLSTSKDGTTANHVLTGLTQENGVITEIREKALADLAFSGNIADLKQTENTYIVFNCGSSTKNI